MAPVTVTAEVSQPAADVFAYATDPSRFTEWQTGVVEAHMEHGEDGPSLGARCVTTRRIGFANRPSTAALTQFDPPRSWCVRGIDGPIRAIVNVDVEPVSDARSRLTISVDFVGRGMGRILVPLLVRREARTEMPVNMASLKAILERST